MNIFSDFKAILNPYRDMIMLLKRTLYTIKMRNETEMIQLGLFL